MEHALLALVTQIIQATEVLQETLQPEHYSAKRCHKPTLYH